MGRVFQEQAQLLPESFLCLRWHSDKTAHELRSHLDPTDDEHGIMQCASTFSEELYLLFQEASRFSLDRTLSPALRLGAVLSQGEQETSGLRPKIS